MIFKFFLGGRWVAGKTGCFFLEVLLLYELGLNLALDLPVFCRKIICVSDAKLFSLMP